MRAFPGAERTKPTLDDVGFRLAMRARIAPLPCVPRENVACEVHFSCTPASEPTGREAHEETAENDGLSQARERSAAVTRSPEQALF